MNHEQNRNFERLNWTLLIFGPLGLYLLLTLYFFAWAFLDSYVDGCQLPPCTDQFGFAIVFGGFLYNSFFYVIGWTAFFGLSRLMKRKP